MNGKELDRQLISEYARREEISPQEAERRIQIIIDCIRDVLMVASRVQLRRLGTLWLGERKCGYKNNHTGHKESRIPLIKTIRFKPAKSLKQAVNTKVKDNLVSKFRA
jgi:nucleoid DNA-binding protein